MNASAQAAASLGRIGFLVLAGCIATAAAGGEPTMSRLPTAPEIVASNVAARGGLEAWRRIGTMIWVGHLETGNPAAPILPFVMELERPNKTRLEIRAEGQQSVRIFDGVQGWKQSRSAQRDPSLQPYTAEEVRSARDWQGIDGFLIDHAAKGIEVALEGVDLLDEHAAYRLLVRLPSGSSRHLWIDARTYLEAKYDRESRTAAGQAGTVPVYLRGYQTIDGLKIPMLIETGSEAGHPGQRMVIESVTLNPPLEPKRFAKPQGSAARVVRGPPPTLLPAVSPPGVPGAPAVPRPAGPAVPPGPATGP